MSWPKGRRGYRYVEEWECKAALRECVEDLGHTPTVEEYNAWAATRLVPSYRTIYERLGSWPYASGRGVHVLECSLPGRS